MGTVFCAYRYGNVMVKIIIYSRYSFVLCKNITPRSTLFPVQFIYVFL